MGQKTQKIILPASSEDFKKQMLRLSSLVNNTIITARRIMTNLRPEVLDMLGFVDAVKSYLITFQERNELFCVFENKVKEINFDSQKSVALYRIMQESLNNIVKHAQATKVIVRLENIDDKIIFEISDNGNGFDTNSKKRLDSYGIIGMKERAYLLDAELQIESTIGKGTSIKLMMPINNN